MWKAAKPKIIIFICVPYIKKNCYKSIVSSLLKFLEIKTINLHWSLIANSGFTDNPPVSYAFTYFPYNLSLDITECIFEFEKSNICKPACLEQTHI